ncbi:MAG: orotate phosphoribosyltransferase [Gemmatimonadales bacterium]|nr:orotate phosphoribosyltransferase [Gemmatimonadales bacterium]
MGAAATADDLDELRKLLLRRAVTHGDFVLSSGRRSSYYIDCRLATMSAEGMIRIGRLGLSAIQQQGWKPAAVGGLTMGADPVAYAIAAASYGGSGGPEAVIDAFSVRKQAKEHGTGRLIEGNFSAGRAVVVVEDVITSGGSALTAIAAVETAGATVLGVIAVVDREQGGRAKLEGQGRVVVTLTTAGELGLGQSNTGT